MFSCIVLHVFYEKCPILFPECDTFCHGTPWKWVFFCFSACQRVVSRKNSLPVSHDGSSWCRTDAPENTFWGWFMAPPDRMAGWGTGVLSEQIRQLLNQSGHQHVSHSERSFQTGSSNRRDEMNSGMEGNDTVSQWTWPDHWWWVPYQLAMSPSEAIHMSVCLMLLKAPHAPLKASERRVRHSHRWTCKTTIRRSVFSHHETE